MTGDGVVGQGASVRGHGGSGLGRRRTGTCPTRRWLAPLRLSTAPGSARLPYRPRSPVVTTASARLVGIPSACMPSPIRYSRSIGPSAAFPSPPPEERGAPGPARCRSRRRPPDRSPRRAAPPGRPRAGASTPPNLVARVHLGDRHDLLRGPPGQQRRPPSGARSAQGRRPARPASSSFSTSSSGSCARRRPSRHGEAGHLAGVGILEPEQGRRNGHASETTGQPLSGKPLLTLCRVSDPPASAYGISIPAWPRPGR